MSDMTSHAKLTRRQGDALALAVALVIAGMLIGFTSSFVTLYGAAQGQHWRMPALLPLAIDSGILAYVLLDHLAIALGARSRWLHLVAAGMAAFTVWANAAVAPASSDTWRAIHAAMPALWVLGVEALRFTWRRLHEPQEDTGRIPRSRWLAYPVRTWGMRKRMIYCNVTSYAEACAREDARMLGMDLAVAVFGKRWKREAPALLRHHLVAGTLPADVAVAAAEGSRELPDTVEAWVAGASAQRDKAAARARQARRVADGQDGQSDDRQPVPVRDRQPKAARTVSASAKVKRILTASPALSTAEVIAKTGASESTVTRVRRELPRALHTVPDAMGG